MDNKDPYIYRIKQILKVVDGDTIDASIDLGFDIALEKRIRLAGVDTPESRTADVNEKKYGIESKEWLKHKIENAKNILIKTELPDSTEKYGRIIGHLFINDQTNSLNEQMIDAGMAWSYDGGAKKKNFAELDAKRTRNS